MASRVSLSPQKPHHNGGWPESSSSLPPLAPLFSQRLESGHVEFPINEECTSLAMVPSGRHLVAGFTDGTLRLFDLTGKFQSNDSFAPSISNEDYNLFDSDSSDDEGFDDDCTLKTTSTGSSSAMVCSKSHQRYGAVLAQIHAKGVHTSLQMTVAVSPDGVYAFGGVARGSMELVAVDLSQIELHLDTDSCEGLDFLDLAQVHRFADAKLRGFGACTRLQTYSNEPTYILLTGKGIKNIHIWSFQPSLDKWQCLYDTQSNGNSISTLHLRYSPSGSLQAISKSDSQKLRVWDLSHEQSAQDEERPKRPPYVDMSGTEAILGIGGDFGFAGCLYQQISLVNLNVDAPYNVTELELPHRGRISGRQQRGQMQSLQQVAGMSMDASHVLLEMSDFSVVHFYFEGNVPKLETLLGGGDSRTICVARIGSSGITVAAMASGGSIVLRQIGDASLEGYWGFHGLSSKQKDMPSPCADSEAIAQAAGSSVNLFAGNSNKRPVYTSLALEDNTVPTTPDKTPDATVRTSNVVPISDKTPTATKKNNGVPLSAKTSATVPASAVKALGSNGVSLKARATPETKKPAGVAVSPETADEESTKKKKKKKKKADVREDDNKENKLERKKLVLHIRVSKESEPLDKKEEATATIAPRELHPTSSADSSMKSRSNLKKKKGALPKRPSTEPSKSEPSDKKEEATATVAPRELHSTSTADSSMKSKSNLKKKKGVSPKRPSTEPSKSESSDKKEDATTTVAPAELHSISTADSSMESRSIPKKRKEFLHKRPAAEPSRPEPLDKKEEATATVAPPELDSTSTADSSMESRSIPKKRRGVSPKRPSTEPSKSEPSDKKEDATTTVAPPELHSTSSPDSSMKSKSNLKKKKGVSPKRPSTEPSKSEPSDKKEDATTTVAPTELHSISTTDSSMESRSIPKKREEFLPKKSAAEPSKSEEPRDKKEEATTTVALPEIHSTSSAESSMKSRSKKEDAMTTVAPPELDSTSTADSSMESRSIPKKRRGVSPKRPSTEPSKSQSSDKKEEVKTTVAPPELHSTSSPDSSTKSRSNPKKRRGVSPKRTSTGSSKSQSSDKKEEAKTTVDPTELQSTSRADSSMKSPGMFNPKKRKGFPPRRPVAERAQPFKKSRAVIEANLGNLNAVTLPPADGWKLPSMSVSRRFGSFKASETEVLRIKLVLEHRASHETLRKKVLESVPQLMRSANQEDPPSVEELKDSLEDVIVRYTEILEDLLFRQEMEASALAAIVFLPTTPVVSFPFPEVFDQARKTMSLFLDTRKESQQCA